MNTNSGYKVYGEEAIKVICPYCETDCTGTADYADIGVGLMQCGPHHCEVCDATEISMHAERDYNDPTLDATERKCGWRKGGKKNPMANYLHGKLVSHSDFLAAYTRRFRGRERDTPTIKRWYEAHRRGVPEEALSLEDFQ